MKKTAGNIQKGDVFWVNFDPSEGTEIQKMRPAIVISNNLINKHLPRLIVVPVTSNTKKVYDFDSLVMIDRKLGKAMVDQLRAIDKGRLGKKICTLTQLEVEDLFRALKIVFAIN